MKVYTIGGYNEVGRNMTAIETNNEIVIFDMGYNMEKVVQHNQEIDSMELHKVMDVGAIPNDRILNRQSRKVKAIIVNHGHYDHCGAVPFLANAYKCPIITPPFSSDVIRKILSSSKRKIQNPVVELKSGQKYRISKNLEVEFIAITHSIPDTVLSVLRTKEGNILYANDFKLDDRPTLGEKPDYKKLKELENEGIKLMFSNTVHMFDDKMCPSESEAKIKLENVHRRINNSGLVIGTTFASQISRLKSFIEIFKDRKIVFLGRSMHDFLASAEKRQFIDLLDCEVYSRREEVQKALNFIEKRKQEYLILCTGNQGEPNAILPRIADGRLKLNLGKFDNVIFSCSTIPVQVNIMNRHYLEQNLREKSVEMYKDVHASGHAFREDLRYFLKLMNPEVVIPCHGDTDRSGSYAIMARDYGYELNKNVLIGQNGKVLEV